MTQQAHYFKIGLFVIGAITLAVVGVIIVGGGKWFEQVWMAETYFTESVQGLEIGAPVRLHGVRVGRVESIRLAREEYNIVFNPETGLFPYKGVVAVRMSIDPSVIVHTPEKDPRIRIQKAVDAGFRMRLASQGITGVLYIESEFLDPEYYPPMQIAWTPKTSYIPSAPSTITELGTDLRSLARKLDHVEFEKITKDFDAMLASINRLVREVQEEHVVSSAIQLIAEMRGTIQDVHRMLDDPHLAKAFKDSALAMEDIRRTAKDARETVSQLPDVMTRLNRSLRRVDTFLASKGESVDELLENLQTVSEELRYLTQAMEKYPSQVLFGEPPSRAQAVKR